MPNWTHVTNKTAKEKNLVNHEKMLADGITTFAGLESKQNKEKDFTPAHGDCGPEAPGRGPHAQGPHPAAKASKGPIEGPGDPGHPP